MAKRPKSEPQGLYVVVGPCMAHHGRYIAALSANRRTAASVARAAKRAQRLVGTERPADGSHPAAVRRGNASHVFRLQRTCRNTEQWEPLALSQSQTSKQSRKHASSTQASNQTIENMDNNDTAEDDDDDNDDDNDDENDEDDHDQETFRPHGSV